MWWPGPCHLTTVHAEIFQRIGKIIATHIAYGIYRFWSGKLKIILRYAREGVCVCVCVCVYILLCTNLSFQTDSSWKEEKRKEEEQKRKERSLFSLGSHSMSCLLRQINFWCSQPGSQAFRSLFLFLSFFLSSLLPCAFFSSPQNSSLWNHVLTLTHTYYSHTLLLVVSQLLVSISFFQSLATRTASST